MKKYLIPARIADNRDTPNFEHILTDNTHNLSDADIVSLAYFFKTNKLFTETPIYPKYKSNLMRNLYIIGELKKIYELCSKRNIEPPILLKGCAYIFKLYEDDCGYRFLSDIDIYEQDSIRHGKIIEILYHAGYVKGSQYIETFEKNNIKIDIHSDLLNSNRVRWRKKFFNTENLEIDTYEKDGFKVLNNNIDFIYCLLHSAVHHGFTGFKWLLDAHLFLSQKLVSAESILKKSILLSVAEPIRFCLTFYNQFFSLSDEWIKTFQLPYKLKAVHKIINAENRENLQYYINFIFSKNSDKPGLLFNLFFPERKALQIRYNKNSSMASLYFEHYKKIMRSVLP